MTPIDKANERFDGVDRALTGDPVPGRLLADDEDGMAHALIVLLCGFGVFAVWWLL